jgi:hypothetical protein
MVERTGRIVEWVDVVLLGESLAERSLQCAEVGDGKLEALRRPLAGHEERRLRVLVLLRLALRHCALCAGILGFSVSHISTLICTRMQKVLYVHCLDHLAVGLEVGDAELLAVTFS